MKAHSLSALLLLAIPVVSMAASNPDASFFKKAAEGGLFEVQAGTLAQQKGASEQVKDFGAMMVKDHSAANDKLKALAGSKSIDLPGSASVGQMATKAKLEVLSGSTFDKSYIKSQISAHRDTIALLRKEISSGQDPDAKAFASEILPTVRAHLKSIVAIAGAAGVSSR